MTIYVCFGYRYGAIAFVALICGTNEQNGDNSALSTFAVFDCFEDGRYPGRC